MHSVCQRLPCELVSVPPRAHVASKGSETTEEC